jgi:hypothetical protein
MGTCYCAIFLACVALPNRTDPIPTFYVSSYVQLRFNISLFDKLNAIDVTECDSCKKLLNPELGHLLNTERLPR